jgi:hypothetical protein
MTQCLNSPAFTPKLCFVPEEPSNSILLYRKKELQSPMDPKQIDTMQIMASAASQKLRPIS